MAVETHAANHPGARHLCESMENLDPRKVWAGRGRLDLLWGSPECTHHSVARGGRPIKDQSRASAWHVVRWAEALRPRIVCVENVPEFTTWGPIGRGGRPIARLRGEVFLAWRRALEALGCRVEHRILNAADYGEATTRRRLFVQAVLRGSPRWPEPTHAPEARSGFVGSAARWRPAREVIDWTLQGRSIFGRARPLSPKTMARIEAGIRRFWGAAAEPFLVVLRRNADARSLREPAPAVCAGGMHPALAEPFLLPMNGERRGQELRIQSPERPLGTITTENRFALVEPFVLGQQSGGAPRGVAEPLPTVTGSGAIAFVMPITHANGDRRVRSVEDPLPTITAAHRGEQALVEPFITKAYGTGTAASIGEPLPTATAKDRFGLVESAGLDIRFRMLQPHELAAAMGFPSDYRFAGNKGDAVRQIGNAVSVRTARAICREALARRR